MNSDSGYVDAIYERWSTSPIARADPKREMAWLSTHRQKAYLYRALGSEGAYMWLHPLNLLGCPIYIGLWNPDPLPLFLPEPTIRSMVGIWMPRYASRQEEE